MRTKVSNKKINSQIKKPHLKRIPNEDNYKFGTDPTMEDQIRRKKNWIYKKIQPWSPFGARGTADRGVESLRFQVCIVRRLQFQFLPKPARDLLGQKRGTIDNNYGRQ